ncbi:Hypp8807 [Branchiostoma lanceolatum]|uniref:Hypp8807 protein n=1 Tax=Branchiostoma lanceolatum TaxID=7740 RepID=A0A8J9ZAP7_BRALA|nr:Hypp8807 [Branchiostoma lanceolatum]
MCNAWGYNVRGAYCLGIFLVILGIFSILLGVIGLGACYGYCAPVVCVVGAPIWSGFFVLLAGILAIRSAYNPGDGCLITSFVEFAILVFVTSLLTITSFVVFAILAFVTTLLTVFVGIAESGIVNEYYFDDAFLTVTERVPVTYTAPPVRDARQANGRPEGVTAAPTDPVMGTDSGVTEAAAETATPGGWIHDFKTELRRHWPYYENHAALLALIIISAVIEVILTAVISCIGCGGICSGYHGHEAPAIVVYDGTKATPLGPGQRAVQQPDGGIKVVPLTLGQSTASASV